MLVSLLGVAAITAIAAVSSWMPIRLRIGEILGVASEEDVRVFPDSWHRRIDVPSGERDVLEIAELLSRNCDVNLIIPGKYEEIPERKLHIGKDMYRARPEEVICLLRDKGWRLRRGKLPGGGTGYTFGRSE